MRHVWTVFTRLRNEGPPGAITCRQLLDYQDLYGIEFADWELDVYRGLDAVYLRTNRAGRPGGSESEGEARGGREDL